MKPPLNIFKEELFRHGCNKGDYLRTMTGPEMGLPHR